jgi:hypothetical protein
MGGMTHGRPGDIELAQGPVGLLADGDDASRTQDGRRSSVLDGSDPVHPGRFGSTG